MLIPAALLFFISGIAALIYQVAWQRLLVIFSGADVHSATVVIAAFMAGLGCGMLLGGHTADRVNRLTGLMLFAVVEAGIALYGYFSPFLLYDVLYHQLGHLATNPIVTAAVLFSSLLWPTVLMGMSLPLLSRALVRTTEGAAPVIGWLYAANTLGAAAGALAATWVLMPDRGIDGTLRLAAGLNAICALGVIPLAVWVWRSREAPSPRVGDAAPVPTGGFSLSAWMWLYGLAGFIALSFEIVWFRMLGVMLKSTSLTFGTLVAQYLLWLGLGSALGSVLARRSRRPAAVFLWTQTAAAVYVGVSVAISVRQLPASESLAWLYEYLGTFEPVGHPFRRYLGISAVVIGPATLLMGIGFPFLQRAVQTDLAYLGRRVGALLLANIAGSTLGTMATGWLLLGLLGTSGTVRALVALSGIFAVVAISAARVRRPVAIVLSGAAAALIALSAMAVPDGGTLWATLHGASTRSVLAAEDGSGVSVLKGRAGDFSDGATVFVNGLGQSWLPYGGVHTELGALPAMIHPAPRDAAVIGLGSGDTLFALAGRREIERITSIEIIRPQLETLRRLVPLFPYPALVSLLADPRIEHVFDDGRAYVRDEPRRFDIIEADALRPTSAYAGNLYSEEYFGLLRSRLRPGGYAVTWAPTDRVARTFHRAFPYVVRFDNFLVGSSEPIVVDADAIGARVADPEVQAYYAQGGINIAALMERMLSRAEPYDTTDAWRAELTDLNTDLYPRDEFGR